VRKKILIVAMIAMVFSLVIDFSVTLIGQPEPYWQGVVPTVENPDLGKPNESNLIGYEFLLRHPIYFILFGLVWLAFLIVTARWLIDPLCIIFSVGITIGHMWAALSWSDNLIRKLSSGFFGAPDGLGLLGLTAPQWYVGLIFITSIFLMHFALHIYKRKKG